LKKRSKGGWGAMLLGILFALAFCPTSGVFYFGMLIPMSATTSAGYLLPIIFAVATAIPVLAVAWVLAFSVQQMGNFYGKIQKVQKWANLIVGVVFIIIGIYYCWIMYL
jgi:cytochrome c biogenesis protein